jgi:hypothetical protein
MTELSRRAFLKTLGIGLAASAAPWGALQALEAAVAPLDAQALLGRALEAAPVVDGAGRAARTLFPDEIVPIAPAGDGWYAVKGGRVRRTSLQPISAEAGWAAFPTAGDVAQVSAPYALARGWCAADAPVQARIGWGGTALVADGLALGDAQWLGLRFDEAGSVLWSPADAWRKADMPDEGADGVLVIERRARTAALVTEGRALWRTPVVLPRAVPAGEYALRGRSPVARASEPGAPWELDYGAWRIYGAYWHNRFGEAQGWAGTEAVEVSVLAARALYACAPAIARVV